MRQRRNRLRMGGLRELSLRVSPIVVLRVRMIDRKLESDIASTTAWLS